MRRQTREIAHLCFKGARYDGRALDAAALEELVQFQKIVTEMARAIWKKGRPDRERLPRNFEECTQFVFRRIEDGSTIVPLEISSDSDQDLWGYQHEVVEAVNLIYGAFVAVNRDEEPLPEGVPRKVLPSLAAFGKKLLGSAEIQFAPPDREMTPVSPKARQRLDTMAKDSYVDELEITGLVLEADVRQRRFQIWMEDGTNAQVRFTEQQKSEVATALEGRTSIQLLVKGYGKFHTDGLLKQIQNVEYLEVIPDDAPSFDPNARRVEGIIEENFSKVPDQEWDKVPSDLSHQHDFYLYRIDKR